jgi:hypothetical protein
MINSEDIKGKFIIVCEKCGSRDISIYSAGIYGEIVVYCNKEYCGNECERG